MKLTIGKLNFRRVLVSFLVLIGLGLAYGVYYINSLLPIITGYPAKFLCSAVFVSGREQAEVEAMDLNFSFIKYTNNKVNFQDSSVISSFLWGKSKAIFRKGFGATLLRGVDENDLRRVVFPGLDPGYDQDTIAWPLGNLLSDSIPKEQYADLEDITGALMDEDAYGGHAFAFMVLHHGVPVAEAYQPQFNSKTRFPS